MAPTVGLMSSRVIHRILTLVARPNTRGGRSGRTGCCDERGKKTYPGRPKSAESGEYGFLNPFRVARDPVRVKSQQPNPSKLLGLLRSCPEPAVTPSGTHEAAGMAVPGIDLGTTNSVVATVNDGEPSVVPDDKGRCRPR